MTNTPDEATLVSIKYNMNMLLALLPVNGKTEFDMGDASIMASVPSFVVMASAGAVPKALDYTLPRVPVAISDADIARIADAVRPAPGFTGGEVFGKMPATGPFPLPGQIYTDPMPIWTSSGNTDADGHRRIDGVGEKKDGCDGT